MKTGTKVFLREMKYPLCTHSLKPNPPISHFKAKVHHSSENGRTSAFNLHSLFDSLRTHVSSLARKCTGNFIQGVFGIQKVQCRSMECVIFASKSTFYYDYWSGKSKLAFSPLAVKKQQQHLTVGCHACQNFRLTFSPPVGPVFDIRGQDLINIITDLFAFINKKWRPF